MVTADFYVSILLTLSIKKILPKYGWKGLILPLFLIIQEYSWQGNKNIVHCNSFTVELFRYPPVANALEGFIWLEYKLPP